MLDVDASFTRLPAVVTTNVNKKTYIYLSASENLDRSMKRPRRVRVPSCD